MSATDQPLVFITGANQGVGLGIARILAKKHNYRVLIGSRNKDNGEKVAAELRDLGHTANAIQIDLNSESSIAAVIAQIEKDYGYLDILINNAGILIDHEEKHSKWDLFTKTFQTNVVGPATLTYGLLPLIRKARHGPPKIIFLTSTMGSLAIGKDKTTPWYNVDYTAYDASKAAVNMLMINIDRTLEGTGAKVNAVCPGLVATNMNGYTEGGADIETGAARAVELAVDGADGVTGTYSRSDGPLPW